MGASVGVHGSKHLADPWGSLVQGPVDAVMEGLASAAEFVVSEQLSLLLVAR